MGDYPQPPPIISKFVDSLLRESSAALSASRSFLDTNNLSEATAYLETVQANILHLGRLADVQTLRHGIPPESTDVRDDCGLCPRDELLQTFAQSLMAHYLRPPQPAHGSLSQARDGGGGPGNSSKGMGVLESEEGAFTLDPSTSTSQPAADSMSGSSQVGVERKGKWSLDEDARLLEGIAKYTERKPQLIANYIGTRTSAQVRDRLKQLRKQAASDQPN